MPRAPLTVVGGTKRRRYTARTKITSVIAAEMTTNVAAAKAIGANESVVRYWMHDPAFAIYREKAREELGPEGIALAHKVLGEILRRLPEFEPRDLSTLYGILIDKAQLVTGEATSRTETKAITSGLTDHESAAMRKLLDEALAEMPVT